MDFSKELSDKDIQRALNNIERGDYIAFFHPLDGLIVDTVTMVNEECRILVHYICGYKSEAEWVEPEDVLAVGDYDNGVQMQIGDLSGPFIVLKPEELAEVEDTKR